MLKDKKIDYATTYELLKNKFFLIKYNLIILNNPKLENYKLEIFYNDEIKQVDVFEADENYVNINGVKYVNFNTLPINYFSANQKLEIFFFDFFRGIYFGKFLT